MLTIVKEIPIILPRYHEIYAPTIHTSLEIRIFLRGKETAYH